MAAPLSNGGWVEFDDELASYLQPGPFSVVLAACDAELSPETVRAWAPRLLDDQRSIEVFVGRKPGERLVGLLRDHPAVAMAIANVTTYQALQLKGRCIETGEADAAACARVRAHGEAFVAGLRFVGVSERAARGILVTDVVRLRFEPDALFDQTPGPDAGTSR